MRGVLLIVIAAGVLPAALPATELYWTPAHQLAPPCDSSKPAACDLDGDLDYDVSVLGWVPPHHYWNVGTPQSPSWQLDLTQFAGIFHCNPTGRPGGFGDLDADGDQDLVFGCYYGDLHMNWNVGTPEAPAWLHDPSMFQGLTLPVKPAPRLADMDADGDLDLVVVCDAGWQHARYLENTGSPTSPQWTDRGTLGGVIFTYATYTHAAIDDLDDDGDLDIVGSCDDPTIQCWENVGTPQSFEFVENSSMLNGVDEILPRPYGVELLDIDADGDPDLLIAGSALVGYLYLNEGISPVEGRTWGAMKALYR